MRKGKRHTPEQIVGILRRSESGETVATVCRETNISAATFHRWKSQYGGMDLSELQQLRGLRDDAGIAPSDEGSGWMSGAYFRTLDRDALRKGVGCALARRERVQDKADLQQIQEGDFFCMEGRGRG